MARQKLKARAFLEIDGERRLWYEISEDGSVTWHLPKEAVKQAKSQMMKNIGSNMSRYINTNPDSTLWGIANR